MMKCLREEQMEYELLNFRVTVKRQEASYANTQVFLHTAQDFHFDN